LNQPSRNERSKKWASEQAENPKVRVADALVEEKATVCQQKSSFVSGHAFDLQVVHDA
jgi:hypothetical protein